MQVRVPAAPRSGRLDRTVTQMLLLALPLAAHLLQPSSAESVVVASSNSEAMQPLSSFAIVVCEATPNLAGSPRFQEEDAAADV
eukprot:SAG11_NODE_18392_length_492_cov_1.165394_1_plen_83_part_01